MCKLGCAKIVFFLTVFLIILSAGTFAFADSGKLVSVIVKFEDSPLASYNGHIHGYAATNREVTGAARLDVKSKESTAYLSYLDKKHKSFETNAAAAIPASKVVHHYKVVFGGVSMLVPEDKADQLYKLAGVKAVYRDKIKRAKKDRSPFFIGADKLWSSLGGQEKAGENVVVGVIDTGLWPEHPSFSDPDHSGKPYPQPPPNWKGICEQPKDNSPAIICNNKLVGARVFLDTWKSQNGGTLSDGDFDSVRDSDGHGTHTSSTAAGNAGVAAQISGNPLDIVSGIAPRARVAMYRALAAGFGYDSDLVAAIEQAVADGVDVINYSIGSSDFEPDPYSSADDMAFLDAYKAGVFVAAAAGNDGPVSDTVNHLGGWTVTVGAGTIDRSFTSKISLVAGDGTRLKLSGSSVTSGINIFTPVVAATDFGDQLCLNPFPAGTFSGQIVVCERGQITRIEKSFNVLMGGGSGMILYNPSPEDLTTDNDFIPTVHLDFAGGEALLNFLIGHGGANAKFTGGAATKATGNVIAFFSSRGGPAQTLGISKPDLSAPGVQILAGNTPEPLFIDDGPAGELFQVIEGTSMASPHVAGAAALLKDLHPQWTPGQIKSALMTTAKTSRVFKEDGLTPADSFDFGSGRLDLTKAGNPGLTFDVPGQDFIDRKNDLWNVNYPSIYVPFMQDKLNIQRTAHSELTKTSSWKISVSSPSDLKINTPASLTIPASGSATFDINIDASLVPDGGVRQAAILLKNSSRQMHIPVTIVKRTQ